MPRPASTDLLRTAAERLLAFADQRRIAWIPGTLDAETLRAPTVTFTVSGGDETSAAPATLSDVQGFITALERLDVAMVVASIDPLTTARWEEAVELYENALADLPDLVASRAASMTSAPKRREVDNAVQEKFTTALRDAKSAKSHIGEVASIDVWAVTRNPTVVLNWFDSAAWFDVIADAESRLRHAMSEVEDDASEIADSPAQVEAQRAFDAMTEQRRIWTSDKRREVARQLAGHTDFPRCKTESDKVYLLESLLGADAPTSEVTKKEIARAASAVYKFEIAARGA
jgi:hypothetical protein